MSAMMIPFDGFELIRIGVYEGVHCEPIVPPLEDDEKKKAGWCILGFNSSQSTVSDGDSVDEAIEALDRIEKGKPQEDDYETVRMALRDVDHTTTVLWGLPRKVAPAAPEPKATQTEPAPPATSSDTDEDKDKE